MTTYDTWNDPSNEPTPFFQWMEMVKFRPCLSYGKFWSDPPVTPVCLMDGSTARKHARKLTAGYPKMMGLGNGGSFQIWLF